MRSKKIIKTERLAMRVSQTIKNQLVEQAQTNDCSMSKLIERFIQKGLKNDARK